jgi:hypothetical protein
MSQFRWAVLVVSGAMLVGCGDSPQGLDVALQVGSVGSVVEGLEAAGVNVDVVGHVSQSFYPADATQLRVDGEEMMVFEYESEAQALANSTSRPLALWTSTPHFYLSGRFMAFYVGTTGRVLEALEEVFGEELES